MKKLAILLIAVLASVAGASAMSLKDAFGALSKVENIQTVQPDYNLPVIPDVINDYRIAAAYNLDAENILKTGNAALDILNQLPLTEMINGANNNQVAAFVFTEPNDAGTNDILVVAMSGYRGSVVCIYGTVDNDTRYAIQQALLQMEGSYLSLNATMADGNEFNIILSKAR